jgi:type I restriction enzyme S subunit
MILEKAIPKEWNLIDLSELSELITKGTTPTTNGFPYLEDGVNFVKVESIHSNGSFIPSMFAHVGSDCHHSFKRSQLNEGDILFTIAGALGRSAIVKKDILPANTNQAVAIIRLNDLDNKDYIFHYLRGNRVKELIKRINVSTAQANLSLGQINKFKIPLPPLPEQQKIAEILSTVDAKIEIIDQQISETQELKKGLMQQLLTKGIGHTEFKDSALGKIPKSWEVNKIGETCHSFAGGTPKRSVKEYYKNGTISWVKSGEVDNDNITSAKESVTELAINETSTRLIKSKSILVALYGATAGKVGVLKIDACSNQAVLAINSNVDFISNQFLYHFLKSITKTLLDLCQGSGQPNLSKKIIDNVNIPIPQKGEQQKIATILTTTDEKLQVLSEKKTSYQELKQGLMQQLLTGKVRV